MDSIIQEGDPVLRQKAKPVARKDIGSPELNRLIKRMKQVLAKEENGVGLAAPQIGEAVRIFIVAGRVFAEQNGDEKDGGSGERPAPPDLVFINPEPLRFSRAKKETDEGCLSVRGLYGKVVRHEKASVRALDEQGTPFVRHGSGLLAQIFQHELDHLDGILYTDKATGVEPWEEKHAEKKPARPSKKKDLRL